jgi:hypothetical protein
MFALEILGIGYSYSKRTLYSIVNGLFSLIFFTIIVGLFRRELELQVFRGEIAI